MAARFRRCGILRSVARILTLTLPYMGRHSRSVGAFSEGRTVIEWEHLLYRAALRNVEDLRTPDTAWERWAILVNTREDRLFTMRYGY